MQYDQCKIAAPGAPQIDFNPDGGALFAGGGPLTVAAAGSYGAVWHVPSP